MKLRAAGVVCLALLAAAGFYFRGAVREVEKAVVYGGPQLSVEGLRKFVGKRDVRTIISLRGHGRGRTWYGDETALCAELGVVHHTISVPVGDWPPRHQVIRFLDVLEGAEPAVLVHCRRGVDRTGWASAVVDLAAGRTVKRARGQLALWRGHLCRPSSCPHHQFITAYVDFLDSRDVQHSGKAFRRWIDEIYCPPAYNAELELVSPLPRRTGAGSVVPLHLVVRNRGSEPWFLSPHPGTGVRLGVRILGPVENVPVAPVDWFRDRKRQPVDVARAGLENGEIAAGQEREFELSFVTPETPGQYLVQIDMVDEGTRWFSDVGWPGLTHSLRVDGPEGPGVTNLAAEDR